MTIDRLTRVNELLKREIAGDLYRQMGGQDFDFSALTITHVVVSSNLRHAKVYVSIRGHEEDRGSILRTLRKKAPALQQHLRKTVVLKYIPSLSFHMDTSIQSGDRILEILARMEQDHLIEPEPGDDPPSDEPS